MLYNATYSHISIWLYYQYDGCRSLRIFYFLQHLAFAGLTYPTSSRLAHRVHMKLNELTKFRCCVRPIERLGLTYNVAFTFYKIPEIPLEILFCVRITLRLICSSYMEPQFDVILFNQFLSISEGSMRC